MPFEFFHVDSSIIYCAHYGSLGREDFRQLSAFLKTLDADLLIDLSGVPSEDMARQLFRVRSLLPRTALFGPPLPRYVLDPPPGRAYYRHEMRHFPTEGEALTWLRQVAARDPASV